MVTRKTALTACGAILGLMLAAGSARALTENNLMYVTISGPFSLPGVTLAAGTYAFELALPGTSPDLVRVRSRDRAHVYFTGFTNKVQRPAGGRVTTPVVFGESSPGTTPRIEAWYPDDDSIGHEFIYPNKNR
jgi:hypothetical protein